METSSQNICETDHDFNETHDPETMGLCLPRLLDQIVENYEHKTAIISGDKTLTYRELNTLANRFARELIHRGIGVGDLIGVALDRSVDLIPVFLAIWKTGAAYVPIDPALPSERIRQIMEDAGLRLVITCNSLYAAFGSWEDVCRDLINLTYINLI
jgi:reducing polyketide synthase SwnK